MNRSGAAYDVILRVIEEVFDDGWCVVTETVVRRDGAYQHTVYDLCRTTNASKRFNGQLSDSLMDELVTAIRSRRQFKMVAGIPTYTYCVDNHRVRHSEAIHRLIDFVEADASRR